MLSDALIEVAQVFPDLTKLILSLLGSYVFSFVYYWKLSNVRTKWVKNLYIVVFGNVFLFMAFSVVDVALFYVPLVFTFIFTKSFYNKRWVSISNFVITITFISCCHLYAKLVTNRGIDRYVYDITDPLMMLIIKLTSFCFDVQESLGLKFSGPSKIDKAEPSRRTKVNNKAAFRQASSNLESLKDYPNFLEFLGYCLLVPGIFTLPSISFSKYQSFIGGSLSAATGAQSNHATRARIKRIMYLFLSALFYTVIYFSVLTYMPLEYTLESDFKSKPLMYRLLYAHLWSGMFRIEYYAAWMIAEGSYVALGMGFRQDKDGKPHWDQLENVNPLRSERFTDFRTYINEWNVSTHRWLRDYVYRRIITYYGGAIDSDFAAIATYMISATWHGFYPGYFIMFSGWAWMTVISRSTII